MHEIHLIVKKNELIQKYNKWPIKNCFKKIYHVGLKKSHSSLNLSDWCHKITKNCTNGKNITT